MIYFVRGERNYSIIAITEIFMHRIIKELESLSFYIERQVQSPESQKLKVI